VRRPPVAFVIALALALVLAACQDQGQPADWRDRVGRPGTTSDPPTPVPTPTDPQGPPSAPGSDVQVPDDAPTSLSDPDDLALIPEDLPTLLEGRGQVRVFVPPQANVTDGVIRARPEDPIDLVALTWRRGPDVLRPETGFVVWQRFADHPPWRVIYAFTNPPRREVLGIRLSSGDVTGDGIPDLVTFEERGGTGSCGTWKTLAVAEGGAEQIFQRRTCDAALHIRDGVLELQQAVYGPDDPHCCPRGHRFTTLEWDGSRFVRTGSRFEEIPQLDDEG
jgi:hypothetical protein